MNGSKRVRPFGTWLPHREKYLRLVNGFLRDFLELHEELSDDVEREQS